MNECAHLLNLTFCHRSFNVVLFSRVWEADFENTSSTLLRTRVAKSPYEKMSNGFCSTDGKKPLPWTEIIPKMRKPL
jgi:hypothetical protein